MERKIQKKIFVFRIIPFQLGVANSHNLEQDTSHRKSVCRQTPLRFRLKLRETFSKSTSLRIIKNIIKSYSWRFRKHLSRFHMLTSKACSETILLREFFDKDFQSLQFRKYISYDDHLFFQNVQNLTQNTEME